MILEKQTIVISGCQQGIGLMTMEVAVREGAYVFACCQTEKKEFLEKKEELEKEFGDVVCPLYFDLTDQTAMKNAIKTIQGTKRPITGLANIAGMTGDSLFLMVTQEQLQKVFQVNFFSQVALTQYVTKLMLRSGRGSIVNISSVTGIDGNAGQFVYSATKACWIAATRTLSKELGPKGIRVNAVAPGVIESPMTEGLIKEGKMDDKINSISLKHCGKPEDVANAIVFLLSGHASYITGQVIRIDGAMA